VFALLALEELGRPVAGHAVTVITITVVLSVVIHGATADPLAARYARLLARSAYEQAGADTPGIPERRLIRRTASGAQRGGADTSPPTEGEESGGA
jgi:NhaP-type Na+/H+ or K+/H+ antiporter